MNLAYKLKHRIQILQNYQVPDYQGGAKVYYRRIGTFWASVETSRQDIRYGVQPVGYVNQAEAVASHEFLVRYESIIGSVDRGFAAEYGLDYDGIVSGGMGKQFSNAFGDGVNSITDIDPIKASYFIFLERENVNRGRLFKIRKVKLDEDYRQWIRIECSQVDERGTGFNECLVL